MFASTREAEADPTDPPADAGPSTSSAGAITPPRLIQGANAERTDGGREPAVVGLEIVIDESGTVREATVTSSAGEAFDNAALQAVRSFRFAPASRDGVPVAVKVRYEYVFAPAEPAESEAPPAEPRVSPAPEVRNPIAVPNARAAQRTESAEAEYGATAEVQAPRREATRRTIEGAELTSVPGAQGDALRAIEILPGVGRSALGTDPILRGASDFESQVFFDGAAVPLLYHFGGVKSFVNSRLLDRVEVYPGNFSVRYGRRVGGVIEARSRELRYDAIHGLVDLSLLDSAALVEVPLTDHTAVAAAARRSNIDFVFESIAGNGDFSVVAAPLYWDYQGIVETKLSPTDSLRVMAYGSRDGLAFFFDEPDAVDPTLRGDLEFGIEFHRLQANVSHRLSDVVHHEAMVSLGTQRASFAAGASSRAHFRSFDVDARSELAVLAAKALDVRAGIDLQAQYFEGAYIGNRPPQIEGAPLAERSGSQRVVSAEAGLWFVSPAAYVELAYRPVDSVSLVPGLRADYFGQIESWSVDPRLTARFSLSSSTALKSGVGVFSEPPQYYEALPPVGNAHLRPYHAVHHSFGIEQALGDAVNLEAEGFYKWIWDRVVATPGGRAPYFVNDGEGRIVGLETSASVKPSPRTYGYASYTLSRSQRRDRNGEWRLFDEDQTHVLSLAASYDLGRRWTAGARFRYVTGNPTTPVVGSVYDATSDLYRPIFGRINSERNPAFHQLDVRIEKTWLIGALSLSAYLDVQNVYNAENAEGVQYGYDYSKSEPVTGMPLFPNLGVRGEL